MELINCPDCGARPGEIHILHCNVERCSHCGYQRLMCCNDKHDPFFARWTGFWPGVIECSALGLTTKTGELDLGKFYGLDYYKIFFVKPSVER
jgi:hypothetical protein